MALRWHATVVDALDPARLARWWGQVLGLKISEEARDHVCLPGMTFVRAAQHRDGSHRLRLEFVCADLSADLERLLDMGARRVTDPHTAAVVLADPEGNEFILLPSA